MNSRYSTLTAEHIDANKTMYVCDIYMCVYVFLYVCVHVLINEDAYLDTVQTMLNNHDVHGTHPQY